MSNSDVIKLSGRFDNCIIGVYKSERHSPQPIDMELAIHIDTRQAARSSRLGQTLDYAKLVGEAAFILETSRFLLLESAADAIARYLLAPAIANRRHPRPEGVKVRLAKPSAISQKFLAQVEIFRVPDDYEWAKESTDFGTVDIIGEYRECGIYRLNIAPGHCIATHVHKTMGEREMALTDGLMLQNKPLAAGMSHAWPHNFPHRYDNPTAETGTILCIDSPKFDHADEVVVAEEPRALSKLPAGAQKDYYKIPN